MYATCHMLQYIHVGDVIHKKHPLSSLFLTMQFVPLGNHLTLTLVNIVGVLHPLPICLSSVLHVLAISQFSRPCGANG